jgi:hypothetical protein
VRHAWSMQIPMIHVPALGLLGIGVFSFVQHDLRTNISGVRHRHESAADRSTTLEKLVSAERDDGHKHATGCLVRLFRCAASIPALSCAETEYVRSGLAFTLVSLRNTQANPQATLHTSFKNAYDSTLKHHHGWAVRNVVNVRYSIAVSPLLLSDDYCIGCASRDASSGRLLCSHI